MVVYKLKKKKEGREEGREMGKERKRKRERKEERREGYSWTNRLYYDSVAPKELAGPERFSVPLKKVIDVHQFAESP